MNTRMVALLLLVFFQGHAFDGTYARYDALLEGYVCKGGVAYQKIKEGSALQDVVDEFLSLEEGAFGKLDSKGQLAYLINLYNFYTVDLIVRNLPLKTGIRDISSPWDQEFVPLFGDTVSLNHIEHKIIREKYDEPRTHFALVCASKGCPALRAEAFVGDRLDEQLNDAAKTFLTDAGKNRVAGNKLFLSKIFDWYGKDFKKRYGGYEEYVKKALGLTGDYAVTFIKYDWTLNGVDGCP